MDLKDFIFNITEVKTEKLEFGQELLLEFLSDNEEILFNRFLKNQTLYFENDCMAIPISINQSKSRITLRFTYISNKYYPLSNSDLKIDIGKKDYIDVQTSIATITKKYFMYTCFMYTYTLKIDFDGGLLNIKNTDLMGYLCLLFKDYVEIIPKQLELSKEYKKNQIEKLKTGNRAERMKELVKY